MLMARQLGPFLAMEHDGSARGTRCSAHHPAGYSCNQCVPTGFTMGFTAAKVPKLELWQSPAGLAMVGQTTPVSRGALVRHCCARQPPREMPAGLQTHVAGSSLWGSKRLAIQQPPSRPKPNWPLWQATSPENSKHCSQQSETVEHNELICTAR